MTEESLEKKLEKIREETKGAIEEGTAIPEDEFKKEKEKLFEEPGIEKGQDYDKGEEFPKEED